MDGEVTKKSGSDSGLDSCPNSEPSCDEDDTSSLSDLNDEPNDAIPEVPERNNSKYRLQVPYTTGKNSNSAQPQTPKICPYSKDFTNERSSVLGLKYRAQDIAVIEMDNTSRPYVDESEENNNVDPLPPFWQNLVDGQQETIDFGLSLDARPPWLDEEKFKRGQKFAREHLFCINFSEMLSLVLLFPLKTALAPLIFTGKSHTPFKAFKRYLSTVGRIKSWYEGDVWNDPNDLAKKNLSTVRALHKNAYEKLTTTSEEELERRLTLGDEQNTALWCPLKNILQDDFKGSCPIAHPGTNPYDVCHKVWLNQLDMSVTQFAFVGLAVTYPKEFGIHFASEEDLEAFIHMWRGIGFLLGIKDKYNFCNASLADVRQRTREFIHFVAKPALRDVSSDWEHMTRCLIKGISFYISGANFETSLLYLCDLLNIHTPRFRKLISFSHYLTYLWTKFAFRFLLRIPGMLSVLNYLVNAAIKHAQESSPRWQSRLEAKKYPYMKQPGKKQVPG